MLNVDDLAESGLTHANTPGEPAPSAGQHPLPPLEPGSALAGALARVWRGDPGTLLCSPPGGGKSTSVVTMVAHLVVRAGLKVVLATPTRAQAMSIAVPLFRALPPDTMTVSMSGDTTRLPPQVRDSRIADPSKGSVLVCTLRSCQMRAPQADLLVVDEGFQATFSEVSAAARNARQILMVGDSGQIGPVVTANVAPFTKWRREPHLRAPDVLGRRPDFATFTIGTSYRLGPATVAAISPLYDFPFVSGRPERAIIDRDGAALDEIDSIDVGPVTDYNDPQMLGLVVQRADALVWLTRHDADQPNPRQVRAADVAVVLSRNTQVCFVRAMLDARGHDRITVGTADRLQGGQWAAVVALDPFAGSDDITSHNLSLGRLCVMTSRHTTHLTWVHDGQWQQRLTTASLDPSTVKRGMAVRRALTAWQTGQHTEPARTSPPR